MAENGSPSAKKGEVARPTERRRRTWSIDTIRDIEPPTLIDGKVIHGFGRGSRDLGYPTANLECLEEISERLGSGVFCGWAKVGAGSVYPAVVSIGWHPFYKNKTKALETYILHKFEEDFYGERLKLVIVGFIRAELDFKCKEDLIAEIASDVKISETVLGRPHFGRFKSIDFFDEESG